MADIKLEPLLEAAEPELAREWLEPFFGSREITIESRRLEAPVSYWQVYRSGEMRVTLKCLFSSEAYERYCRILREYHPDRIDRPDHPLGGLVFRPELNGILWSFPCDPAMPEMHRCLDAAWIGGILRRGEEDPLSTRVLSYLPEIGLVVTYHNRRNRTVAYGKTAPEDISGRVFVVMDRLWRSPARRESRLRIARPLAFRPQAGLLLQAAVPGRPVPRERNRRIFLDLVQTAGVALAAVHETDLAIGDERPLEHAVDRLEREGLRDIALTAPLLHTSLRSLISQIEQRAARVPPREPVLSHGDFKWDQFVESSGRFSLIDFELFCQAEPEYDLGYFCAYLPPSTPEGWEDGMAVEMLRAEFLRSYVAASGTEPDYERLGCHEAAALGLRALAHVWAQAPGWHVRASQFLDLAFERLVSPEPRR